MILLILWWQQLRESIKTTSNTIFSGNIKSADVNW